MITQNVTTITPTNYTAPFYRTIGANVFMKWTSDTKILVVDSTVGAEYIRVEGFPNSKTTLGIAETTVVSDATAFNAARDAVEAVLAAL